MRHITDLICPYNNNFKSKEINMAENVGIIDSLLQELLSDATIGNLASAAGVDKGGVTDVISAAIPTLLTAMAENSTSEEGASSLAKALTQHSSKTKINVPDAVKNADIVDGQKIISHILGGNTNETIDKMSKSTNLDKDKISRILSMVAPIILTFIARGKKTGNKSDSAFDMTDMLSSFVKIAMSSNGKSSAGSSLASTLISSLLTGNSSKGGDATSAIIGSLLNSIL